ncbi:MAG: hypothetical protein ABWY25_06140 [Paenisporosarcina sp.]
MVVLIEGYDEGDEMASADIQCLECKSINNVDCTVEELDELDRLEEQ